MYANLFVRSVGRIGVGDGRGRGGGGDRGGQGREAPTRGNVVVSSIYIHDVTIILTHLFASAVNSTHRTAD